LRRSSVVLFPLLLALLFGLGCAATAWERARKEDTAAAYHTYLRDHPDSEYAERAKARLALVRLRQKPSAEGYDAFRAEFPDADLLAELAPSVERAVFERARAAGTAEAYREFLEEFAASGLAERARGNAEFLEAHGFQGRADELAAFAKRNPDSDYAAEAQRSAQAVAVRSRSSFRNVGLAVEIEPGTPGAERLIRVFRERAQARYAEAGLTLVPLEGSGDPRAASLPVRLTIHHRETTSRSDFAKSSVSMTGIVARTQVILSRAGDATPIWSDEFTFHDGSATPGQNSVLFGPTSSRYWTSFFVPVATWDTSVAVRAARSLSKPVASVAVSGSRAVVLYTDGDLEMFDLGDPEQPALLGAWRRKRDLTQWSGVHIAGDRIAIFGPDGIEVIGVHEGQFALELALDRGAVGTIVAMEDLGPDLLAAGNRGLVRIDAHGARELLLDRPVRGLARLGERLLFTDGTSLLVSTPALLLERRVEAELRLGRGFAPGAVHVDGSRAVVVADRGVAVVDLSMPRLPRLESRVETTEAGEIRDAARIAGRLFVLGARGLQLTDPQSGRVVDSACVSARERVAAAGRHLVMVGEKSLQVVDATPFVAGAAVASPGP
jgi:hypothetical protein